MPEQYDASGSEWLMLRLPLMGCGHDAARALITGGNPEALMPEKRGNQVFRELKSVCLPGAFGEDFVARPGVPDVGMSRSGHTAIST